ncbi:hypothetical protein, conserved [Eimeria tenella]|uniref:Helicase-associated domain-containing protein n=1 Tax=Eimeria tenella TaxID=5802 RepID=U6KR44_EIMTE|nr:hypothetical protein, conserved [Eimeria tenella]CDJ37893.1 hypothetical protein, conserved [Eimeria tenella]|eukprot:XP_013228731.1 hypothetical protein, conserved [Eimeria tenella]
MAPHRKPDILSCDLSQLFLQLKVLGVSNPLEFPFLDAPPKEAFAAAGRNLYRLEAIDEKGELTKLGRQLTALPLPPVLGALLLSATSLNCLEEALTLVAVLSAENVWATPFALSRGKAAALSKARKQFTDPTSDHLTLVGAYNCWARAEDQRAFCRETGLQHSALLRAKLIREQLQQGLRGLGYTDPALQLLQQQQQQQALDLKRCLAKSCWQQAAKLQADSRQYITVVSAATYPTDPQQQQQQQQQQ